MPRSGWFYSFCGTSRHGTARIDLRRPLRRGNTGIDRTTVAAVAGHERGNITDDGYSGGLTDALLRAWVEAVRLPGSTSRVESPGLGNDGGAFPKGWAEKFSTNAQNHQHRNQGRSAGQSQAGRAWGRVNFLGCIPARSRRSSLGCLSMSNCWSARQGTHRESVRRHTLITAVSYKGRASRERVSRLFGLGFSRFHYQA